VNEEQVEPIKPQGDNGRGAISEEHPWSLAAIARMTQATVAGISPEDWRLVSSLVAAGVTLDSRQVRGGEVFVALEGEHTNGHKFIPQAFESGASAALAKRTWWSRRKAARALGIHLLVDDPAESLQWWGAGVRQRLNPTVVGVTGSTGKTTTKELILALLGVRGPAVGTVGNRNNELGLPWSLLQVRSDTRWAVVEMGTNHPGEIRRLGDLARPDVAVITCIGQAHAGPLGGPEGVLAAKLEILEHLAPTGKLVIPDDHPKLEEALPPELEGRIVRFGWSERADVRGLGADYSIEGTRIEIEGRDQPITVPILGRGAAQGVLAALATARALGLEAIDTTPLAAVTPAVGRLQAHRAQNVTWLVDTYNASPESTMANLEFFDSISVPGRKAFVFGGMRELGDASPELHQAVGAAVGFCDAAVFVGEPARTSAPEAQKAGVNQVMWCGEASEVVPFLRRYLKPGDAVMLKGARAAGLEQVAIDMGIIADPNAEGGF